MLETGQPRRVGLRQPTPLRRGQHHRPRLAARRADVLGRAKKRLGLHHHARPTAIRHIVDDPMPVGREVPEVVDLQVDDPGLDSSRHDSLGQRLVEHPREDRDDVELHRSVAGVERRFTSSSPAGGSITIRLATTSMDTTNRRDQRHQDFPALRRNREPMVPRFALDSAHRADRVAVERLHLAANQLEVVERAVGQRLQRRSPGTRSSAPRSNSASFIESTPSIVTIGRPL